MRLATLIFEQGDIDPAAEAVKFVNPEKEVNTPDDALAGARDIIAEWINENAEARADLRELYVKALPLTPDRRTMAVREFLQRIRAGEKGTRRVRKGGPALGKNYPGSDSKN